MDDVAAIAKGLIPAERATMLDLPASEPWSMGTPAWRDYLHRYQFYSMKLVEPVFPDAKPGNSGRQLWRWNALGLRVRAYLREQSNDPE